MDVVSNAGSEAEAEAATRSMKRFMVKEALVLVVNSSVPCEIEQNR